MCAPTGHRRWASRAAAVAVALALLVGLGDAHAAVPGPPVAAEPTRPAPAIAAPSRRAGATVARIVAPTVARARLGRSRPRHRIGVQTAWSAQPQVLLVLDTARRDGRDWVRLLLPTRPNGSAGWVPRDAVLLNRTRYWVEVRLRRRSVAVYRAGRLVRRFRAVVGAPATPTPRGLAAIYERNRQPDAGGFLGPWALPLTSLSTVLEDFGGGPGRIAIHGRAGASLRDPLGTARSHGCIRIANRHVRWMAARLPPGTPVDVRR